MRAVTVCTASYVKHTRRLVASFARFHEDADFKVYCDDAHAVSQFLKGLSCDVIELASIRTHGVKRAKFEVYATEIAQGPFIYLDSDIIVLDDLSDLRDDEAIVACADDLSGCDFIPDKRHPWPNDPDLFANVYFNSGVVYFPESVSEELCRLRDLAFDDAEWRKYTISGKLYDNHFLCAYVNIYGIEVKFADEVRYNWQGLRQGDEIKIYSENGRILNGDTGSPLNIMHFAGIESSHIDDFILGLDHGVIDVVSQAVSTDGGDILSIFSSNRNGAVPKDVAHEFASLVNDRPVEWASVEAPYIGRSENFLSIALSEAPSLVEWNGFPCGGAYLNAREYAFLRDFIRRSHVKSILEIGAGYTSIMFRGVVDQLFSIEPTAGPWLDAARQRGCDIEHITFNDAEMRFTEPQFTSSIMQREITEPDLLFLDSPVGRLRRGAVLSQLKRFTKPKFIVVHDARRDSDNIFQACLEMQLTIVDYLPTFRGMIVLGTDPGAFDKRKVPPEEKAAYAFEAEIISYDRSSDKPLLHHRVRLRNIGDRILNAESGDELRISYHLTDSVGNIVKFDGLRTLMPCQLSRGDEVVFEMQFERADQAETFFYFDLVCEGKYWIVGPDRRAGQPLIPCVSA